MLGSDQIFYWYLYLNQSSLTASKSNPAEVYQYDLELILSLISLLNCDFTPSYSLYTFIVAIHVFSLLAAPAALSELYETVNDVFNLWRSRFLNMLEMESNLTLALLDYERSESSGLCHLN